MTVFEPTSFARFDGEEESVLFADRPDVAGADAWAAEPAQPFPAWVPSPSIFSNNRLAGRVVPRVPMRVPPKDGQPEKIDPRSVRFTEIVGDILNGLVTSGGIYKTNAGWAIAYVPRQVTGPDAFVGELFFNVSTNRLTFKDNDGVLRPIV